ncbi:MAG: hypothetical protein GY749_20100 [Desulfobacteraceae bacterium]|nr:hypothetical protein [Desulfobacteraceae bacterium]
MKIEKIFVCFFIAVFLVSGLVYADDISRRRQLTYSVPVKDKARSKIRRTTLPATAHELAIAMDIPEESIISASLGDSDAAAVAVKKGKLGHFLPTKDDSFAILATGLAEVAETENQDPDGIGFGISGVLTGLSNSQGNDMVQLTFELKVPEDATCFGFDFVYYSEEYDFYVGTSFNDTFLAELGESNFVIDANNNVTSENNFAFDTKGSIISVNAVFGMEFTTETTYNGGTSLLKAVTPVPDGQDTVKIIFTIQDLGDSIFDSAVFLDNFYWSNDPNCKPGASEDNDGDGLLDDWERNGLDVDGDGKIDVDLPAMGADPDHMDIFVEVDYMMETTCSGGYGFGECSSHSHQPKQAAIQKVIDAFNNAPVDNPDGKTGIYLHVDAGPDFIMNPVTEETWGDLSMANELFHDNYLGKGGEDNYNWQEFEDIKAENFSETRKNIFRYCVFGNELSKKLKGVSGASRGVPASGFVVTMGSWTNGVGTVNQQAGTFMHMLGNNLGIGGGDDSEFRPNYLSIMNRAFQTRGLIIDGTDGNFDYSRFEIPALDENELNEGLGLNGGDGADDYGTVFYTPDGEIEIADKVNQPVDWNNDGAEDTDAGTDINNDGSLTILPASVNEWENLVFKGGEVGSLGIIYDPLLETEASDISQDEDEAIPSTYGVSVSGQTAVVLKPGASGNYSLTIENTGENADSYTLTASGTKGWADFGALPASVSLEPGESETFDIPVKVPDGAENGDKDKLNIQFTSKANPSLADGVDGILIVLPQGDVNADGQVDIEDVESYIKYILGLEAISGLPDANGDGKVNILDLVFLINLTLEPE